MRTHVKVPAKAAPMIYDLASKEVGASAVVLSGAVPKSIALSHF